MLLCLFSFSLSASSSICECECRSYAHAHGGWLAFCSSLSELIEIDTLKSRLQSTPTVSGMHTPAKMDNVVSRECQKQATFTYAPADISGVFCFLLHEFPFINPQVPILSPFVLAQYQPDNDGTPHPRLLMISSHHTKVCLRGTKQTMGLVTVLWQIYT